MPIEIAVLPGDGVGPEVTSVSMSILREVDQRFSLGLAFNEYPFGADYYERTGDVWPQGTYEWIEETCPAILVGAVGLPGVELPDGTTPGNHTLLRLRKGLELYANVRPFVSISGVDQTVGGRTGRYFEDVTLTIVRENTEGLYSRVWRQDVDAEGGVLLVDERHTSMRGSERIVRFAFDLAHGRVPMHLGGGEGRRGPGNDRPGDGHRSRGWKAPSGPGGNGPGVSGMSRDGSIGTRTPRVTCVDKSNVLEGCRLFRGIFDEVASLGYNAGVLSDHGYVDAFAYSVIRDPRRYDVVVCENSFGDILSDLCATMVGGLGMVPSASMGDGRALFEPVHGSAPDIGGSDTANPTGSILSAAMMLEWLGWQTRVGNPLWPGLQAAPDDPGAPRLIIPGEDGSDVEEGPFSIPSSSWNPLSSRLSRAASLIRLAVESVYRDTDMRTPDLGGSTSCSEFGEAVLGRIPM